MIPILFEKGTRYFTRGGICRLSEALTWKVKEALNGEFELEMSYPAAGEHFKEIKTDRIIYAKPNPFDGPQAFVIYAVTKPLKGRVQIFAEHVSHKQTKITVSPFRARTMQEALEAVKNATVGENPFRIETDMEIVNDINSNIPRTLRNAIYGRILSLYGGEIKYDNYYAEILPRRGSDKGFAVRYGKNLLDYNEKSDVSGVYDGIYPYYFNQDPEDEEEFEYVELPEKIIKIGDTAERIMPLNLTSEFQEEPDEDELREAAQRYLEQNDINKGSFSVKINFAILSQTEEYKNSIPPEQVELGDDVSVYIPIRGVTVKSRIVKTVYDGKKGRYESVTVGEIERDIADTLHGVQNVLTENQTQIAATGRTVARVQTIANDNKAQVNILTKWMEENKGDIQSIAAIRAKATANEASIKSLTEWKGTASTSIANVEQKASANEASIKTLTEWKGTASQTIAETSAKATANEASIKSLTEWKGTASQTIAETSAKATANEASIKSLTEWKGAASQTIVETSSKATANEGNITALVEWQGTASTAIASVEKKAGDNEVRITALAKRATDSETLIAQIDQEVDAERARIDLLAEFQTETETNIAEIELDVSKNAAKVGLIVGTTNGVDYVKGGIIAEAINGQTAVKIKADVLDIDIVGTINAKADEIQLISDELLIETTGFRLEAGQFAAVSGTIGSWIVENERIRSAYGVYGEYEYTTTGADYKFATGYMFTSFEYDGIYYIVKEMNSFTSKTIVKISLITGRGKVEDSGGGIYPV